MERLTNCFFFVSPRVLELKYIMDLKMTSKRSIFRSGRLILGRAMVEELGNTDDVNLPKDVFGFLDVVHKKWHF